MTPAGPSQEGLPGVSVQAPISTPTEQLGR